MDSTIRHDGPGESGAEQLNHNLVAIANFGATQGQPHIQISRTQVSPESNLPTAQSVQRWAEVQPGVIGAEQSGLYRGVAAVEVDFVH